MLSEAIAKGSATYARPASTSTTSSATPAAKLARDRRERSVGSAVTGQPRCVAHAVRDERHAHGRVRADSRGVAGVTAGDRLRRRRESARQGCYPEGSANEAERIE